MKIGVFGHGRMGREVEKAALAAGHEVSFAVGRSGSVDLARVRPDVVIDFTHKDAVLFNVTQVAEAGIPMVVGTTGWDDAIGAVRAVARGRGIGLVYGSNFSIGANVFFKLVEVAARYFNRFPDYDPYILEQHHRGKLDAPSGTAIHVARKLLQTLDRKKQMVTGAGQGAIPEDALHVASIRAGATFGRHEVGFDSATDSVELVHVAHGREGFAKGALFAAQWIQGRKGIYEFSEILEETHG